MCVYKYRFMLFMLTHSVFSLCLFLIYCTLYSVSTFFFVNGHFTFMDLKLQIKGSEKMDIQIGTIVDLPFLRMKMAYDRKSLFAD